MALPPFEQLWWERVHGPAALRETLVRAIQSHGVIFFHHSGSLPWPETFRSLVLEEAESRSGTLRVRPPEDFGGQPLSEDDFLARFAPQCARGFLSTASLPTFLDKRGALDGQILWLYGLTEEDQAAWAARLGEFAALPAAGRCVVVLELDGKRIQRKKVPTLSTDDVLRPFDVTQFCTMAVSEGGEAPGRMDYLAALCVELAGADPERLPRLLASRAALLEDPVATVEEVLGLSQPAAVRHVRRAQLKLLLPLLEDLRMALLEQNSDACSSLLPFEDDHHNYCTDLYQIELRHLVHYSNLGALALPDGACSDVRLACEARNKIMHQLKPLDFALLEQVLSIAARWCS